MNSQTAVVFRLREYEPSDFEELYEIDQACFEPGIAYSRVELQFYLKRRGAFAIVAEADEGMVAGFTIVEAHPKGYAHVITIDIREEFRRSGLGTQLMKAGEERSASKGSRLMVLEVAVNNMPAIKFYKRHEYMVSKTIPRYYHGEIDALLMTKKIVPTNTSRVPSETGPER